MQVNFCNHMNECFIMILILIDVNFLLEPVMSSKSLKETDSVQVKPVVSSYSNATLGNLSSKKIASILRSRGFRVVEFPDEQPLIIVGDVAFSPGQVLHELFEYQSKTTGVMKKKIWIVNGMPQVWYFFDTDTQASRIKFQVALKTWSDLTCIKFNKLADDKCTKKMDHGSICVGNFNGCWSEYGYMFKAGMAAQKLSVDGSCSLRKVLHELGHALGLLHQQSRPDRDTFISVNAENFEVPLDKRKQDADLSRTWGEGIICKEDQVISLPVPYDYMSLMQSKTTGSEQSLPDTDQKAVFVTKEAHHQYMLDYHVEASLLQTHYDFYSVNKAYGCEETWIASCKDSGKQPPKCQNLGYVGKRCKCLCPTGFSGNACEKKSGPMFPLRAKAKILVETAKDKRINIATEAEMSKEKLDGLTDDFAYFQFYTIIAKGPTDTKATINVVQGSNWFGNVLEPDCQQTFVNKIEMADCVEGVIVFWGRSSLGKLRTECFSSVTNFEEDGPMFRGSSNELDLVYRSRFGKLCSDPVLTMNLAWLVYEVTFARDPRCAFWGRCGAYRGVIGSAGGDVTNGDAERMTDAPSTGTLMTVFTVTLCLLLFLCLCCFVVILWSRLQVSRRERENDGESDDDAQEIAEIDRREEQVNKEEGHTEDEGKQ